MKSRGSKFQIKPRLKPSYKLYYAGGISILLLVTCISILQFGNNESAKAAVTGDYRSLVSGNWNGITTWERYNGTVWLPVATSPTNADGEITIQNGDTVTVTASVTADQIIVEAGGVLIVNTGILTLNNGTGTDMLVNGSLDIISRITNNGDLNIAGNAVLRSSGILTVNSMVNILNGGVYKQEGGSQTTNNGWTVQSGGTYEHSMNGGNIPFATWDAASTIKLTGVTTITPGNLNQIFGNFYYNCPSQSGNLDFRDELRDVRGNFTMISTGTGSIKFDKSSTNNVLAVGIDYIQEGGTVRMTNAGNWNINTTRDFNVSGGTFIMAGTNGVPTLIVNRNLTLSGGTIYMSQYTGTNSSFGIGSISLKGNFTQTGGLLTETATSVGKGEFIFSGTSQQTYIRTGGNITNTVNYTVNSGATLNTGTETVISGGTFTLLAGGHLMIGSTAGISASGATGNIQVTGTRSFSTGGNYTYNGTETQITGTGLPSVVNNLTFNNSQGINLTASSSVSNLLTFTSGNLTTISDTLTLGTSQAVTGTLSRTSGHVVGYFRRWISTNLVSNILFPVGTPSYYEGLNFGFTGMPNSGGTLTSTFVNADPTWNGFPFYDGSAQMYYAGGYGYWTLQDGDGLNGGTYTIDAYANGFTGINDYSTIRLIYRTNLSSPWTTNGTHIIATGNNTSPVAHRIGMLIRGHYTLGSGHDNPLPVGLIDFIATTENNNVILKWATSSEINNNYFTIERSSDATNFTELTRVNGAGTSSVALQYSFIDENPINGISYYRLKQTDYDGKVSIFKMISVKLNVKSKSYYGDLTIRPNPFTETFTADFTCEKNEDITMALVGMNGKILLTEKIQANEGSNSVNIVIPANISAGNYLVRISNSNSVIATTRVIKK